MSLNRQIFLEKTRWEVGSVWKTIDGAKIGGGGHHVHGRTTTDSSLIVEISLVRTTNNSDNNKRQEKKVGPLKRKREKDWWWSKDRGDVKLKCALTSAHLMRPKQSKFI